MGVQGQIAAIVVTYNRKELLVECITALLRQSADNLDILVIDNASTDGTKNEIERFIDNKKVHYFNTGENIGGAGGFNYGIKNAYALGYDLFWLMDDDTVPSEKALEELLTAGEALQNKFGYLVSKALWTDGTLCKMNIPAFMDHRISPTAETQDCLPIRQATFVSFLVTRETVKKVGLPIKEFFLWADDTNYCFRIIKEVGSGYWVGKSVVLHKMKENQSADIVLCSWERTERFIMGYRNRYYNNRIRKRQWRTYLGVVKTVLRIILFSKDNKYGRIVYMLKGIENGRKFHPEVEYVED